MPTFRERPLTWLLAIATACVDLVVIAQLADHEASWFGALAIGQMCVAGALLVVGRAHRLLRASLFLGTPLVLTAPDYIASLDPLANVNFLSPAVARYVLGISLVITAMASLFSFLLVGFNALCPSRQEGLPKFQFPIIEFFGWTIVVAVSTIVLRAGKYDWFNIPLVADVAAFSLFPSALIVYAYAADRTWFLKAAWIIAAAISLYALIMQSSNLERPVTLGAYAYVVVWALIKRMDDATSARRRSAATTAPPEDLKLVTADP